MATVTDRDYMSLQSKWCNGERRLLTSEWRLLTSEWKYKSELTLCV